MAIRTTAEDVEDLLDHSVDTSTDLDAYIETANMIVDDNLLNYGYSDAKLELIERWLSAHFYTLAQKPTIVSESADGASESYDVKTLGTNFASTRYGQQAMLLDYRGKLAALGKKLESGRMRIGTAYMGRISPDSDLRATTSDMNMGDA